VDKNMLKEGGVVRNRGETGETGVLIVMVGNFPLTAQKRR
jgi:hypothetical protein